MTVGKTQAELEQPAKVYQVEAVASKVDQLIDAHADTDRKLTTVLENQISAKQFEDRLLAISTAFDEKLKDEIYKVHVAYGPFKKYVSRMAWIIFSQLVVIVGGIILLIVNFLVK